MTGGFAGIAGALSGYGQEAHKQNLLDIQQEHDRREGVARATETAAQNPNLGWQQQLQLMHRALQIRAVPYNKKLPKELENPMDILQGQGPQTQIGDIDRTPAGATPIPPPPSQSPTGHAAAAQIMQDPQGAAAAMRGAGMINPTGIVGQAASVAAQPTPTAVPVPPPPGVQLPPGVQERLAAALAASKAQGEQQQTLDFQRVHAQAKALTDAGYDPQTALTMAMGHQPPALTAINPEQGLYDRTGKQIKAPQAKPVVVPAGGALVSPIPPPPGSSSSTGTTVFQQPPRLSPEQQELNSAVRSVASGLGLKLDEKDAYNLITQLPPDAQLKATKLLADTKVSSSLQAQRENTAAFRGMMTPVLMALHQAQLENLQSTTGQDAVSSSIQAMKANPDYFHQIKNPTLKEKVAREWQSQTGLPPPVPLDTQTLQQERSSQLGLRHVNNVRTLLEDPDLQKRMGAILGRVGNAEQTVGETFGLSPAQAEKAQDLRASMNYLFFREGRPLFGGRPPEKLMEELQKTSPNVKMSLPMIKGALKTVERSSRSAIENGERVRFGGKTRPGFKPGYDLMTATPPPRSGPVNPY